MVVSYMSRKIKNTVYAINTYSIMIVKAVSIFFIVCMPCLLLQSVISFFTFHFSFVLFHFISFISIYASTILLDNSICNANEFPKYIFRIKYRYHLWDTITHSSIQTIYQKFIKQHFNFSYILSVCKSISNVIIRDNALRSKEQQKKLLFFSIVEREECVFFFFFSFFKWINSILRTLLIFYCWSHE